MRETYSILIHLNTTVTNVLFLLQQRFFFFLFFFFSLSLCHSHSLTPSLPHSHTLSHTKEYHRRVSYPQNIDLKLSPPRFSRTLLYSLSRPSLASHTGLIATLNSALRFAHVLCWPFSFKFPRNSSFTLRMRKERRA